MKQKEKNTRKIMIEGETYIKRKKNLKLKDEIAGITLIALVITIIVLLILAGVSIAMLTGENGVLTRAGVAEQKDNESKIREELQLAISGISVDYYGNVAVRSSKSFQKYIFENGQTEINKQLGETATFKKNGYKIIYKGLTFAVDTNGTVSKTEADVPLVATDENFFIFDEETGTITGIVENTTKDQNGIGYYYNDEREKILSTNNIVIPSEINGVMVLYIGDDVFSGAYSLESVVLPQDLLGIGNGAFQWCRNLASIIIPNGVTEIGSAAFRGCNSLTSLTIPSSVVHVGAYVAMSCRGLTSINVIGYSSEPGHWTPDWDVKEAISTSHNSYFDVNWNYVPEN